MYFFQLYFTLIIILASILDEFSRIFASFHPNDSFIAIECVFVHLSSPFGWTDDNWSCSYGFPEFYEYKD